MLLMIHVPHVSTKHDHIEKQFEERNVRSKRFTLNQMGYYYVHMLFWKFRDQGHGDEEDVNVMSINGFKQLLTKLGLENMHSHPHDHGDHNGHDHGDHDGHDHGDHDGHDHGDHDGHNHGDHDGHNHGDHDGHDHGDHDGHYHGDHSGHDHGDHSGHDHGDHDGHDHGDHSGHDHGDHSGHDHGDHRHKRGVENDTDSSSDKDQATCLSLNELLGEFNLRGATELDADMFMHLSPALIDLLVRGACKHHDHGHDHAAHDGENDGKSRNKGLVWLYMMLCVTVISLCAVWGILCIPKRSKSVYRKVIQFLMALAAGSMAGDALLHLLPHAMMPPHDHSAHGGHDDHSGHDHDGHDDHSDHGDEHTDALLKGLMAVIGLYSFFFLERLFTVLMARNHGKDSAADDKHREATSHMLHSHAEPFEEGVKFISTSPSNNTAITELTSTPVNGGPANWNGNGKSHHWPHGGNNEVDADAEAMDSNSQSGLCPKLTPLALMIVLGDMFHNFCDGLAIGAAFSASTTVGLSTSIAVFCHELPHEIGDFAVLIKTGLSNKQAIALNFISALSCYLGAVIGMFLGNIGHAPMWIFAGVAGMFLYIALVDLVPEMTHVYMTPGAPWAVYLGLHAGGLICGALLMLILGFYEHDIQTALS